MAAIDEECIQGFGGRARRKESIRNTWTYVGDNTRMNVRKIGYSGVDWIYVTRDRKHWRASCEHGNKTSGAIECWEILE
jgi:hypothetical protein